MFPQGSSSLKNQPALSTCWHKVQANSKINSPLVNNLCDRMAISPFELWLCCFCHLHCIWPTIRLHFIVYPFEEHLRRVILIATLFTLPCFEKFQTYLEPAATQKFHSFLKNEPLLNSF